MLISSARSVRAVLHKFSCLTVPSFLPRVTVVHFAQKNELLCFFCYSSETKAGLIEVCVQRFLLGLLCCADMQV